MALATLMLGGFATAAGAEPARTAPAFAQWHLDAVNAGPASNHSTGAGSVVAVLDSGVDAGHPDLAGAVLPGRDLVDAAGDGRHDPVGHGTAVAALIAGRDDGSGVTGLAPDARILPVRVLDQHNRFSDSTRVADAVRWAVDAGADVINLSLGSHGVGHGLDEAIDEAIAADVVVVACTGNADSAADAQEMWFPARKTGVLAVTGLADDGRAWDGALSGPQTVLAAPAAAIPVATIGDGYTVVSGTSFAAPQVSAAAALIRAKWPQLSAAEVIDRLAVTAADMGEPGHDDRYGFGRLDVAAAVAAESTPTSQFALTRAELDGGADLPVAAGGRTGWPWWIPQLVAGVVGTGAVTILAGRRYLQDVP